MFIKVVAGSFKGQILVRYCSKKHFLSEPVSLPSVRPQVDNRICGLRLHS